MTGELPSALVASGGCPEIPADADVHGWLVGSWTLEVRRHAGADTPGLRGELEQPAATSKNSTSDRVCAGGTRAFTSHVVPDGLDRVACWSYHLTT
jgi:hypothetical protein